MKIDNIIHNFIKDNKYIVSKQLETDFHNIYILKDKDNQKSLIKYIKGFRRTKQSIKDIYEKLKNIKHSNIINIYNIVVDKNDFFIHMEYVSGLTLNQYIKRNYYNLEDNEFLILKKILLDIASTIDFLNFNNIVHTDIIGANIIVTKDLKIKIIDFDFSIILDSEIRGAINIDIYSFIVMVSQILYEQIYLNKHYSMFNNKDIEMKKIILNNFLIEKNTKEYKTCKDFINKII